MIRFSHYHFLWPHGSSMQTLLASFRSISRHQWALISRCDAEKEDLRNSMYIRGNNFYFSIIFLICFAFCLLSSLLNLRLESYYVNKTQEFRRSSRLLLQTTKLLVGTVFPLLLLTWGRCVLFFDVVEEKLFSVHTVSAIHHQELTERHQQATLHQLQ